jgi:hypothetical protein
MKRTMSKFFRDEALLKKNPVRMDQLSTAWRELQVVPELRQWTPVKPRTSQAMPEAEEVPESSSSTAATQRDPHLVAAAKMIAAINRGDFQDFLRSLDEFHQLQQRSTGEILARYAQMKYAFENRPPQNEQLDLIKRSMVDFQQNPALQKGHRAKIEEIKRAWVTVQTFFPEHRQAAPLVDAHDLENAINGLDIPKFLKTLHAIGQVNDPTKRDELYTAIGDADFSGASRKFSIERLNVLMRSVEKSLIRDKDFSVESRRQIEGICRTWRDLKQMNASLHSSSRKPPPKQDLKVAKEALAGLLPPPARR